MFDNHGADQVPAASRAVEYKLDLANKTATIVWDFTHTPPVFTDYMGDVQRLPDGNTFIGWGNAGTSAKGYTFSSITEVTPDNQVVALDQNGQELGRSALITTDVNMCPLGP